MAALALTAAIVLRSRQATAENGGTPSPEEALAAVIAAEPLREARDVVMRPVAPEVDDVLLRAERIGAQAERMPLPPAGLSLAPAFVRHLAERLRARADAIGMFSQDSTVNEGSVRLRQAQAGLGEMAEQVGMAQEAALAAEPR